jgi:hypothetical protein
MGMLERYKKSGNAGMMELVKMIEDSADAKRTQLLNMIRSEDADFAAKVESKVLSFDVIKGLEPNMIAEIFAATPPKFVAMALYGEKDAAFVQLVEKCITKNFAEYKSEKEVFSSQAPTPGNIDAAKKKVIAETRKLEAAGAVKLPVKEVSATTTTSSSGASTATGASPSGGVAAVSTDGTDPNCPAIEAFGMEAPPPGLTGERLDTFLKNSLG